MEELNAGQYIEGVRELMAAYNGSGDEDIYHALYELCYAPNEAALRDNYARNAAHYAELYDAPALPSYDDLPVLLFPVTNDYSVLFDKTAKQFCMNEERGLFALLHVLLFADEMAIPQAAERFRCAENEARARVLAQDLWAAIRVQDFGNLTQRTAEEYHELCPHGELYEMFHAEAALAHKNYDTALHFAVAAYEKRRMSMELHGLLYRAYYETGQYDRAMQFLVLSERRDEIIFPREQEARIAFFRKLSAAASDTRFAPILKMPYMEDGQMKTRTNALVGEVLPRFSEELPAYWAGIYNSYGQMFIKDKVLELMNGKAEEYDLPIYNDFPFDLMKAEECSDIHVEPVDGVPVLLPIAAKEVRQCLRFSNEFMDHIRQLSKAEFNFYRIEEPITVRSEFPFVVGAPIVLRHSPQRRKITLNILADGLSWKEMRWENYELVPNIMRFFGKGVIFDNCFSTAEYTYPALSSIETGLYQHHTQIAAPGKPFAMPSNCMTISEQMKALGYYCVNIQGDAEGVYNGTTRGFDRLIVNHWISRVSDGVERTIRHLEAFNECDNFLLMHFEDAHPYNSDVSTPIAGQTHLPLVDAFQEQSTTAAVFLKPNPLSQYVNRSEIRAMDRQLGYLFDYLTSHYDDDEYIVILYSDHGTSVHARSPYLLSEEQTGAALMARGAGVPALGRVDELTSSVDIYKILGKLAGYPIDAAYLDGNLPEAFGGQRREYTVSNSIYPGQTYKICVRTERHAFHLETEEFTREDGTISLDRYTYHIHERNESYREVFNDALARYFLDIVWKYTESFRR